MKIFPTVLCGGSGTRLWPLSRKSYPKQFSQLLGERSLFQESVLRAAGDGFAAPLIVTNDQFRFIALEQMAAVETVPSYVLIEPSSRNTAPAVLAAALCLRDHEGDDALMLVMPSDHVIPDGGAFRAAVAAAADRAMAGDIVTFGIEPTRPETGYGYLEVDGTVQTAGSSPQALLRFVEKPDAARAAEMLAGGRHLWNAGIFLFSVKTIVSAYRALAPELFAGVSQSVEGAVRDLSFTRLAPSVWDGLENVSIDYAIMEKSRNLAVMPYAGEWSDLGDWAAVRDRMDPDANGVALRGAAHAIDCRNTLLRSEDPRIEVVGLGLDNIVAIATTDAVLVADRSQSQNVRKVVDLLKAEKAHQAETFPKDHRPWGWLESLVIGQRFQVKRIHVHPGAALSLQSHHHRSEHWIVVEGTAKVTIDDDVRLVTENQSVYIPLGATHRMENPGKVPMVLIEVQTGSYLGEDDIVRYEDIYSRTTES